MSNSFTILLPVHRNSDLIPYAIESVLWQTIQNFELFIICDGAPDDTVACATQFAIKDSRIRVFSFAKGARHGEAYRHLALQQANGCYVAHICDDDLWFPNHLEEMIKLLRRVDFGNVTFSFVDPDHDNRMYGLIGDLENKIIVDKMLNTSFNFFGPTAAGYTMDAYKRLAEGWSPAPDNIPTDLFMWRKFFSTPGLTFGSRIAVTSCHFAASQRKHFSPNARKEELYHWFKKIQCSDVRDCIIQQIFKNYFNTLYEIESSRNEIESSRNEIENLRKEFASIINSSSWRITKPLRQCMAWISLLRIL